MIADINDMGSNYFEVVVKPNKAPAHHLLLRFLSLIIVPSFFLFGALLFGSVTYFATNEQLYEQPIGEGPEWLSWLNIFVIAMLTLLLGCGGLLILWRLVHQWAWYLVGTEEIRVTSSEFTISRRYLTFVQTHRIARQDIDSITYRPQSAKWFDRDNRTSRFRPVYFGDLVIKPKKSSKVRFGGVLSEDELAKLTKYLVQFRIVLE